MAAIETLSVARTLAAGLRPSNGLGGGGGGQPSGRGTAVQFGSGGGQPAGRGTAVQSGGGGVGGVYGTWTVESPPPQPARASEATAINPKTRRPEDPKTRRPEDPKTRRNSHWRQQGQQSRSGRSWEAWSWHPKAGWTGRKPHYWKQAGTSTCGWPSIRAVNGDGTLFSLILSRPPPKPRSPLCHFVDWHPMSSSSGVHMRFRVLMPRRVRPVPTVCPPRRHRARQHRGRRGHR